MENKNLKPSEINKLKRIEETKKLVELFLVNFESDIELSKKTGISSSTIGRRLASKELIVAAFPKNGEAIYNFVSKKRQQNLQKGKILGAQKSMLSNTYEKDEEGKFTGVSKRLRLDIFYSVKEKQMKLLMHIALTFRTNLSTLANLFQIDENTLLNELLQYNPACSSALKYLFFHDNYDQSEARAKLLDFYNSYLDSLCKHNITEQNRLIKIVTDGDAKKFLDNRKSGDKLTDDDIMLLLNYQLKYATSFKTLATTFGIERINYQHRVEKILKEEPEISARLENILNFNSFYAKEHRDGRQM